MLCRKQQKQLCSSDKVHGAQSLYQLVPWGPESPTWGTAHPHRPPARGSNPSSSHLWVVHCFDPRTMRPSPAPHGPQRISAASLLLSYQGIWSLCHTAPESPFPPADPTGSSSRTEPGLQSLWLVLGLRAPVALSPLSPTYSQGAPQWVSRKMPHCLTFGPSARTPQVQAQPPTFDTKD